MIFSVAAPETPEEEGEGDEKEREERRKRRLHLPYYSGSEFGSDPRSWPGKKMPNGAARRSPNASYRKSKKNLPVFKVF